LTCDNKVTILDDKYMNLKKSLPILAMLLVVLMPGCKKDDSVDGGGKSKLAVVDLGASVNYVILAKTEAIMLQHLLLQAIWVLVLPPHRMQLVLH